MKGILVYLHPPPYFETDCPQSSRRGSDTSSSSSSGSIVLESSISVSRALDMSIKSCRGGMSRDVRAKYGITRKAAIGRSNTDPSNSATIYAPPLFLEITMRGPK